MSLRPFSIVKIQQVPTEVWNSRTNLMDLDFLHLHEIESGWENHTDKAKIMFPKNIQLDTGKFLFQQSGTYNVILGGSGAIKDGKNVDLNGNPITFAPLIMRGDVVYIQDGYMFKNEFDENITEATTRFNGYITKVHSRIPIEIECEDNFYLLKRTPVNITSYKGNLMDLCQQMLDWCNLLFYDNPVFNSLPNGNPYPKLELFSNPDSITANFSLGHLDIGSGLTCSMLLNRLRTEYHLESFFVGNTLRFGFPIYDETLSNNSLVFEFYNNIQDDSKLEYTNKDDIVLSAIVSVNEITKTGRKTKDGKDATKKIRKTILVYWDIPTETFKYILKNKGESLPENDGGERHSFVYPVDLEEATPSDEALFDFGKKQLQKYFYTGFRGSFVTIGYPFVKWNDNVNILDPIMADRNGKYKVKKVKYTGGVDGLTQEVFLDYKFEEKVSNSFREIYII